MTMMIHLISISISIIIILALQFIFGSERWTTNGWHNVAPHTKHTRARNTQYIRSNSDFWIKILKWFTFSSETELNFKLKLIKFRSYLHIMNTLDFSSVWIGKIHLTCITFSTSYDIEYGMYGKRQMDFWKWKLYRQTQSWASKQRVHKHFYAPSRKYKKRKDDAQTYHKIVKYRMSLNARK